MDSSIDKKQKLKNKYHNEGGKEKAREYYQANKEAIREKAKNKYREWSEEQTELKRQYSRARYKRMAEAAYKLKQFFIVNSIRNGFTTNKIWRNKC